MQQSRLKEKTELSAELALEMKAWQKKGNIIKLLPACHYAHQLWCVQDGRTQESERIAMRSGQFVPPVTRAKPALQGTRAIDDYQRAEINARQRAVYSEWIQKGLTTQEAEKIANKEKRRLFYALRRSRDIQD